MAQVNAQDLASGTWLLLGAGEEIDGLRGAILEWKTGDEIPLASLLFDGSALRLQMQPDEDYAGEVPILTMQLVEDRFEGYWMNSNGERMHGPQAPKLKLVRYQY